MPSRPWVINQPKFRPVRGWILTPLNKFPNASRSYGPGGHRAIAIVRPDKLNGCLALPGAADLPAYKCGLSARCADFQFLTSP